MNFVRESLAPRLAVDCPRDILRRTDHRPWPVPKRPWIMTQTWRDLLFIHWPIEPRQLAPVIPQHLTLDTFDGAAWLAIVPFWMSGIRLRGFPPISGTSSFPEINVRTYVRYEDKPGVYFISLDAPAAFTIAIARRWFHLNYYRARIQLHRQNENIEYKSDRVASKSAACFHARYKPIGPSKLSSQGSLEHWLTERYCLYASDKYNRLYRAEILHQPWPLQPAEIEIMKNTMTLPIQVEMPSTRPLLHYSHYLQTLIWSPELVVGK